MNSIIIFGDNRNSFLNSSWIENLKKYFSNSWITYDLSIKNETVTALEKRILQEGILRKEKEINLIILFSGFSDAEIDFRTGKTVTEPAEFKKSIKNILLKAEQITSEVLIVGIPLVDMNKIEATAKR